jgi:hypothetical protein
MPLCFWVIAEHFSSGTLVVTLPKVDYPTEALADIQATTDIEKLRHRAKVLTEMQSFDHELRQMDTAVRKRLIELLWIVVGFSGLAFLINAGVIWWLRGRKTPADIASAL